MSGAYILNLNFQSFTFLYTGYGFIYTRFVIKLNQRSLKMNRNIENKLGVESLVLVMLKPKVFVYNSA